MLPQEGQHFVEPLPVEAGNELQAQPFPAEARGISWAGRWLTTKKRGKLLESGKALNSKGFAAPA